MIMETLTDRVGTAAATKLVNATVISAKHESSGVLPLVVYRLIRSSRPISKQLNSTSCSSVRYDIARRLVAEN